MKKLIFRRQKLVGNFPILLLPLATALHLSACSTATISLQSSPNDADIFIRQLGTGEPKLIGRTPLNVTPPELKLMYGGAGPVYLEFRKQGYESSRTIVTDLTAIDLLVSVDLIPDEGLRSQDKVNAVIDRLFECQALAVSGRAEDALAKLRQVETEAPQVSAIYELQGGIYYTQKKYREALGAYTLAVRLNPKNPQSLKMLSVLQTYFTAPAARLPAQENNR